MGQPRSQGRFLRIKRAQRAKDFANLSEQLERQADPLEQAKAFIRAKGWRVFADERGGWFIGTRGQQSDRDLFDFAKAKGWEPKPRDAKEVSGK